MAGIKPGKRWSISRQREVLCISTPQRSPRIRPASRRARKCCDSVDLGINPGVVITEGVAAAGLVGGPLEQEYVKSTALGRVGAPSDIAQVVLFLASPASGWLTGETLFATGGVR
ncbi:MAG TPA: SDR family oxidoreductase [Tepidisphaeraceae bacterium]|nr:SDR family oxidoreductase [Tepidisphaeraceae bacterium]